MLLAKLMQLLRRVGKVPFDLVFLTMDPGYRPQNRCLLEENATRLAVPLKVFETDVFQIANAADKHPCYLCARMRRGYLYSEAQALGCNKIALGHHFDDVIETTVMSMLYGGQLQGMMPKLHATNYPGMELIRPLYGVHEDAIIEWTHAHQLTFLQCACRFTERSERSERSDRLGQSDQTKDGQFSKRAEVKKLIQKLNSEDPDVGQRIFSSLHAVHIDTFPGWRTEGRDHSFLETYDLCSGLRTSAYEKPPDLDPGEDEE